MNPGFEKKRTYQTKRKFDPTTIKRSNLSKRKIAILIGVNRETVRKVSKDRPLDIKNKMLIFQGFEGDKCLKFVCNCQSQDFMDQMVKRFSRFMPNRVLWQHIGSRER